MFKVTIGHMPAERIIRLTTFGTLDLAADRILVAEGMAAAKQYQTNRFLVDHRFVTLSMRLMDVQDVPLIADQAGLSRNVSIALLHNETEEAKKIFSFLDDLSFIQDRTRKAFTDESEAIAWLTSQP